MTVRKILNTTRIRRVLTHSFAAALIAKGGFLSTASAKEIVIDFEGNEITQERLLEGLEKNELQYVNNCNTLAKTLEKAIQNKELTITTDEAEDLRRDCLTPFHHLIVGDVWDHVNYQCFEDPDKDLKMGIEAVKFVAALEILAERDAILKQAERNLCDKAREFLVSKFPNLITRSCRSEGFKTQLKEFKKEADPMPNIVLQNGVVEAKTSSQLFKDFKEPFRLTFDRVEGVFCAGDTLKQLVVSLAFSQSHLEFTPQCFEKAPLLESLIVKDLTLFIFGDLSFAACPKLEGPFQGGGKILLDADRPGNIVSAFNDCPNIEKEGVKKVALNFFINNVQNRCWTDKQAEAYLENNQLHGAYLEFFYRFKAEQKSAKLEKDFESLKKEGDRLEKEILRLKTVNKNQRNEMEALCNVNKSLKDSLKTAQEDYNKLSQELLQVTNKYENFEKQQTKIVENLTKELEGINNTHGLTNKQLREAWDENKKLRKELKNLQLENKTQKGEIESLQAFKEEWKDEIETIIPKLEEENKQLKKQLEKTDQERVDAKEMLNREREKNRKTITEQKQTIKELKENLEKLQSELAETRKHLWEAQKEIDDFRFSEANILTTVGMLGDNLEEPKEEIKNDNFRPNFQNIFRHEEEPKKEIKNNNFRPNFHIFPQAQNTKKKNPFYSKKKGKKSKKGGKYVEYNNAEFVYE